MICDALKKNFGFGCMRLPLLSNGEVDCSEFSNMIDEFMNAGFNYFDTAHGYLDGKSEKALKKCLVERYPREEYIYVNKLSGSFFKTEEEIRPFFESQLEVCGVDYFDIYLMHAQNFNLYNKYKATRAYEIASELKKEGKIKHVGISFHDTPEVLDMILTEHPEVEIVQIQFNYSDYNDESVQSKKCYEVCKKHGKPIIVMEPVRGGSLANLPAPAEQVLNSLGGGSPASYAIRFAASFEGIVMVLSGMSNLSQLRENISFMKDFVPLSEVELKKINEVCAILKNNNLISCTGCEYCVSGCPKGIKIPALIACMNKKNLDEGWNSEFYYDIHTKSSGKASDCIKCGKCEVICPQKLPIRKILTNIAKNFEQL